MTRMSREFTLVLLGSGLLSSGYFLFPEQEFEKRTEEDARRRVGGSSTHGSHFVYLGHYSRAGTVSGGRAPAMGGVSRGGLGSIGARAGG